jgi:Rieske Fe-S protein
MFQDPRPGSELTRRSVVAASGVLAVSAALAACSSTRNPGAAPASQVPSTSAEQPPPASHPPPTTSASAAPNGERLASTSDIPVGGGKVFAGDKVVVTQPTPGTFKAFSAICTHRGCTVNKVADGTIDCPCHGSKYAIADGSVVNGPAQRSLAERAVTVSDDALYLQS